MSISPIKIHRDFSPHLCVGFLFLVVHFRLAPPGPPAAYSHTQLAPTQLVTTQLAHTNTHNLQWTPRLFAWQGWHLATSTLTLRGRRGTYGTGLALVARLGPSWRRGRRGSLRGRRGTWRHRPSLCVAGVALGDMDVHFAWQAWHLATRTCTLRGRRGTYGAGLAALGWLWWHTWVPVDMTQWTPRLLRGTWRYRPSLCVAGVALMALGWLWWRAWFPGVAGATHHLSHTTLSHTIFHTPSLTHHLSHTTLSHTIFHTPSFTHHFVTHHLWHTIFHTQLCHAPSLTHQLSHTTLSHTIFHT